MTLKKMSPWQQQFGRFVFSLIRSNFSFALIFSRWVLPIIPDDFASYCSFDQHGLSIFATRFVERLRLFKIGTMFHKFPITTSQSGDESSSVGLIF